MNISYDSIGFGELDRPTSTIEVFLNDVKRVQFMNGYLDALATAIRSIPTIDYRSYNNNVSIPLSRFSTYFLTLYRVPFSQYATDLKV